jgi:membrane-associated phospholipid phosphatase
VAHQPSAPPLRNTAARALSIIGHPALLMPAAIVATTLSDGAPAATVAMAAGASVAIAGAVLAYSFLRVRSGAWAHPDASRPAERLQLNLFLLVTLLAVAALSYSMSRPRAVTLGALLCSGIIAAALLLRARLKVSLHVAFAMFAAALCWPSPMFAALLALAGGLAWSRLALRRHTPAEVVLGAIIGTAAGLGFLAGTS